VSELVLDGLQHRILWLRGWHEEEEMGVDRKGETTGRTLYKQSANGRLLIHHMCVKILASSDRLNLIYI
jgi:hypothetical protein